MKKVHSEEYINYIKEFAKAIKNVVTAGIKNAEYDILLSTQKYS
ncbi:hypothetical protein [Wolbachia endosymbiont of Onchocerca gibsoni]|nr:hypothetical protein [Wolbachia endosymbiont of Onchocerca gibsoni]